MKRVFRASVTLENLSTAPESWTGEFEVGSAVKAASSAVRAAFKALPNRRPTSVVVLVEYPRHAS